MCKPLYYHSSLSSPLIFNIFYIIHIRPINFSSLFMPIFPNKHKLWESITHGLPLNAKNKALRRPTILGSSVSFFSSVLCIYTEISQELNLCKTLIRLQREINVIDCGGDIKYQAFLLLIKNMATGHGSNCTWFYALKQVKIQLGFHQVKEKTKRKNNTAQRTGTEEKLI